MKGQAKKFWDNKALKKFDLEKQESHVFLEFKKELFKSRSPFSCCDASFESTNDHSLAAAEITGLLISS